MHKYILVPYFIFCYMVYTRLRVILVAGLRYVPFLMYVVLLGVVYRTYFVTVYQRGMGHYRNAQIRSVPPRPNQ